MEFLDNSGLNLVVNKLATLSKRESYYNIRESDTFSYSSSKGFYNISSNIGLVIIKTFGKVLKYYYNQELEKNNLTTLEDNVYNVINTVLFNFNGNKKLLRDYYLGTYHDIYEMIGKTKDAPDLTNLPKNAKVYIGFRFEEDFRDGFYMRLEPLDDYHYCLDSLEPLPTDIMINDHPYTFTCRGKQVDFTNTKDIPMVYFKFEALNKSVKIKVPLYYDLLNYYMLSSSNFLTRAIINESDRSIEINPGDTLLFNGLFSEVTTDYTILLKIIGNITSNNQIEQQKFEEDFGDAEVTYHIGGDLTSLALYKKGYLDLPYLFKDFNHALLNVIPNRLYEGALSYIKLINDKDDIKLQKMVIPSFVNLFNNSNISFFELDLHFCGDDIKNDIDTGFYCLTQGMIRNCKQLQFLKINIIIEPGYNKRGIQAESHIIDKLKFTIYYTLLNSESQESLNIKINSPEGNISYSILDRYHVIDEDIIQSIENRIPFSVKQVLPSIKEDNITEN